MSHIGFRSLVCVLFAFLMAHATHTKQVFFLFRVYLGLEHGHKWIYKRRLLGQINLQTHELNVCTCIIVNTL